MEVYKNIFLIYGVGYDSNVYVIDGQVIVDTGTGNFFAEMKNRLEKFLNSPFVIEKIINTHCHFDHIGGNKKFRDWLKAKLMVHKDEKKALETGVGTLSEFFGEKARIMTVDKVLKNGDRIKTKNFNFTVLHTPGHTPGSICLLEKHKGILISGDTLFEDSVGRTDMIGGNKKQLIKSIKKLSKYSIKYLFPGHGKPKISGVNFLIKQVLARKDFWFGD